jgi:membrane-associated phospholipid phosphatase
MRSRLLHLVAGAAACAIAAAVLLLATYVIGGVGRWDVSAFRGLMVLGGHPAILHLGHRIVDVANLLPSVVILAAICAAGVAIGRPRHAAAAALLVGGAAITTYGLKILLAHPRYEALLGSSNLAEDAFPSGHATTAMAIALAAVLVAPRSWRPAVSFAAASYALAVGVSAVIIGVHFPSDVLGGFLVAGSFGLLAVAAVRATDREHEGLKTTIWAFDRSTMRIEGPPAILVGAVVLIGLAVMLAHYGALLSYAAADTSGLVAAMGIALASTVLVYGVAAEANAARPPRSESS